MALNENANQQENEKLNPFPFDDTENDTGASADTDPSAQQSRMSVRDGAPSADQAERQTLSEDSAPLAQNAEPEGKETGANVAGGMKTITDKQALLTKEMSKVVGNLPSDDLMALYASASNAVDTDQKNMKNAPETFGAQRDKALATLLACHGAMLASDDETVREFAKSAQELNQMKFGVDPADCEKLCGDIADPKTDWTAAEESVKNEEQNKVREKSTVTDQQAAFARAEIESLQGKEPKELVDYFQNARKETRQYQSLVKHDQSPEATAIYDHAFAKMLAGEYALRQTPDLKAQSTLLSNRGVYDNLFNVRLDDVNELMSEIRSEREEPQAPTDEPLTEEMPAPDETAKEAQPISEGTAEAEIQRDGEKQSEEIKEANPDADQKGEPEVKPEDKKAETEANPDAVQQGEPEGKPENKKEEPAVNAETPKAEPAEEQKEQPPISEKPKVKRKPNLFNLSEQPDFWQEPKPEEKERVEQEPKVRKDQSKELSARLDHVRGVYEATTGVKEDPAEAEEFGKTLATLEKTSPELRESAFAQMISAKTRSTVQSAISAAMNQRKNGKTGATLTEATDAAQNYVKAQFEYYQAQNPSFADLKYPLLGGLQPGEVRDLQNAAFLSLDPKQRTAQEKKAIGASFVNNRTAQDKALMGDLHNTVVGLNRDHGVRFSSAGMETYMESRWKESAGKDLDTQREKFKAEMKELQTKAYAKMLGNITGKTDLTKQLQDFDKLTLQLENICKAKGWMDKNTPHSFGGELNANEIKAMQTNAVNKLPKNSMEEAAEKVKKISSEKPKKEQKKIQKQQELQQPKPKAKEVKHEPKKEQQENTALNNKKAAPKKPAQKIRNKHQYFLAETQKMIDKIPTKPDNFDNPEARKALNFAMEIEKRMGTHGKAWRLFHPFKTATCEKAVKNIMTSLQEKGYTQEIINHLIQNPAKPEKDPVAQEHKLQQEQIEKNSLKQDQLHSEQKELLETVQKTNDGVKISVPEANNIEEIVNPKERSKFITNEKQKDLTVNGPEQTTSPIQQGPSTAK